MTANLLAKYKIEIAIAALAIVVLVVGMIVTQGNRNPPTKTDSNSGSSLPPLTGSTPYSLDVISAGSQHSTVVSEKRVHVAMNPGEWLQLAGWAIDGQSG